MGSAEKQLNTVRAAEGVDLTDASWFAADLHVPRREFSFLRVDAGVLERSVFLDDRIQAPLDQAIAVPVADVVSAGLEQAVPAWLWHTSFCCSTLLARCLHLPPLQVSLKEPLILRRLSDARHAGWPIAELLTPSLSLLARPWASAGAVLVKPTHAALNIATELLGTAPQSRAVVLTSSLEDFLVSNLKKTEATRQRIPVLAQRALQAGTLAGRLPATALAPPDLLCAAALQWGAQRELVLDMLDAAGPSRIRLLDADRFLEDVPATAVQCGAWLQLPASRADILARAESVAPCNAKAVEAGYSAARRQADARTIARMFDVQLRDALHWADAQVLPFLDRRSTKLGRDFLALG